MCFKDGFNLCKELILIIEEPRIAKTKKGKPIADHDLVRKQLGT